MFKSTIFQKISSWTKKVFKRDGPFWQYVKAAFIDSPRFVIYSIRREFEIITGKDQTEQSIKFEPKYSEMEAVHATLRVMHPSALTRVLAIFGGFWWQITSLVMLVSFFPKIFTAIVIISLGVLVYQGIFNKKEEKTTPTTNDDEPIAEPS